MTNPVELTAALLALLEGERLKAYLDSGGVPTIGFGHTKGVKLGDVCTHTQAAAWLQEDIAGLTALVAGLPMVKAAALLSFGYNCGRSNLLKALQNIDEINNPVHTTDRHGNVLAGLVTRRRLEYALATAA